MSHLNSANFWQSIKKDRLLLAILLIGLLLRGLNSNFGSPSLYVSNDEATAHLSAFNMIANKTPISIANYTPLGAYVQMPFLVASFLFMKILGLVSNAGDFELFFLTHEGYFLFIPRLISALFGTLTILAIYKISMHLFKLKEVALISAYLAAVSFNFVHISHFGRPWTAALFFFILAIYLSLKKNSLAAYLAIALSYGFHQIGILAIPLVIWMNKKRINFKNFVGLLGLIFALFVFNNLTLKVGLVDAISRDQSFLKMGKLAADVIVGSPNLFDSLIKSVKENLSFYFIQNLFVTDGILLFGILGIIKKFNNQKNTKKIIIYIATYFIFASLFFHPLLRYLLPIILLLIPFAAFAINSLFGKMKLLIILALFLASINSIWWNYLFFKKPTFIQAHEWINKNIKADTPIAYSGGRLQTFTPSRDAIEIVQEENAFYYARLFLILPDTKLDNVRNIIYVSNFSGKNKLDQLQRATKNIHVDYVVDYFIDPRERLYDLSPETFEIAKEFNPTLNNKIISIPEPLFDASWNFPTNDKRKKVSMYSLTNTGPYVEILKVKN